MNKLKADVYKLDVYKLKTVPIDLNKLSDVADNDVVKKALFNKSYSKVAGLGNKSPNTTLLFHNI